MGDQVAVAGLPDTNTTTIRAGRDGGHVPPIGRPRHMANAIRRIIGAGEGELVRSRCGIPGLNTIGQPGNIDRGNTLHIARPGRVLDGIAAATQAD